LQFDYVAPLHRPGSPVIAVASVIEIDGTVTSSFNADRRARRGIVEFTATSTTTDAQVEFYGSGLGGDNDTLQIGEVVVCRTRGKLAHPHC
jgi:hypothetical protein